MDTIMEATLKQAGAAAWGTLSYGALEAHLPPRKRAWAERLLAAPKGVIVAAFPYFPGRLEGNLSVYARGMDYHTAVLRRLQGACRVFREAAPGRQFVSSTDHSPLPEALAASMAGVGIRGRHGLIICPPYGSYVFLGTILTNLPLENRGGASPDCEGCGRCIAACPTGALHIAQGIPALDTSKCLSHLTQKKGELTEAERQDLAGHPYIWGCDLCQNACPHNKRALVSPLPELTGTEREAPYLENLTEELLLGLDEDRFQEKFGNRAFAWRGLAVIKRNLSLHKTHGDASY